MPRVPFQHHPWLLEGYMHQLCSSYSNYMTTSVSDMEAAYTDAAGRTVPDQTELGAGNIGGLTLASWTLQMEYWGHNTTDVTLSGGAADVWIFQIAQDLP